MIALVLAAQANAAGPTINVNPRTGNDRHTGSTTSPLRTLAKALSKSRAGDTINLAGGTYSANSNSEQYSTINGPQPVVVPSGVTIQGNTSAHGGEPTGLIGASNQIGLLLKGNATISDISMSGFGVAIEASQGNQTLSGIKVGGGGGLRLTGTANTTLSGPVQLTSGFPFSFEETSFGAFASLTGAAVSVNDQAHFTMIGGDFFGGRGSPNCDTTQQGIIASGSAQVSLHSVLIQDLAGGALDLTGASQATIDGSKIESDYDSDQCNPPAALATRDTASLKVTNTGIGSNGKGLFGLPTGLSALGSGPLELDSSQVVAFNGPGIVSGPDTNVLINATTLAGGRVAALDASATRFANVEVTNSDIQGGEDGIIAENLTLRGTTVTNNGTGIRITGGYANLGTFSSPGFNTLQTDFKTIQGNSNTGVLFDPSVDSGVIDAVGDLWRPSFEGANAFGFYSHSVTVFGPASGQNFQLTNPGQSINLGPLVGVPKLTPTDVHAHAGKAAHLALAWTHPVSWRQLRSIQLRLYRGAKPVGSITIDPLTARLTSHGTVTLIRGGSRLNRAGKTVTARLAFRLPRALTGLTLRLAVQATDIHGHRQLEPNAGTIRVSR